MRWVLLALVCACFGLSPTGLGPVDSDVVQYQSNSPFNSQNGVWPSFTDESLNILCAYSYGKFCLTCWSLDALVVFEQCDVDSNVLYDPITHIVILRDTVPWPYTASTPITYYGFNLATNRTSFQLKTTMGTDGGTSNLLNSNLGVFYTMSDPDVTPTSLISVRNITSGALLPSNSPVLTVVSRTTLVTLDDGKLLGVSNKLAPYDCGYSQTTPAAEFLVLDALSLAVQCRHGQTIRALYGDTKNLYAMDAVDPCAQFPSFSLYAFNHTCGSVWRQPLPDGAVIPPEFSYDLSNNWIYLTWGSTLTYQMVSSPPGAWALLNTSSALVAIDTLSYLYTYDPHTLEVVQYSPDTLKKVHKISAHPPVQGNGVTYSYFLGISVDGFFINAFTDSVVSPSMVVSVVTQPSLWSVVDLLSWVVLALSLVIALALAAKHSVCGEDPKGWNRQKLFDLVGLLLTSAGVIAITIMVCLAQRGLLETVEDNTEMFYKSLPTFADEYLEPCASSTNATSVGLCTCTDNSAETFRQSGCQDNSCSNDIGATCYNYLQSSCACENALYQWSCDCNYETDNTCTATATATQQLNPTAKDQWQMCAGAFAVPVTILQVNKILLIGSTSILMVATAANMLTKFDKPLLDFIVTILSLVFAVVQALLLVVGGIYVAGASDSCISEVLSTLPGCVLDPTAPSFVQMQAQAAAALRNAYANLGTTPIMFFISALPDLLALFLCCRGDKSEHVAACARCCCFWKRSSYQSLS